MPDPRYPSANDARMRLNNSFCRFEGVPVLLRFPNDGFVAEVFDLKTEKIIAAVDANDEERLDIESLPLGYVNYMRHDAGFAVRYPSRQQKQGVSADNTKVMREAFGPDRHHDSFGVIRWADAFNMFEGIYPDFEQAKWRLEKDNRNSSPFHRKLCLVRSPGKKSSLSLVKYAGRTLGFALRGKKEVLVVEQFADPAFRILLSRLGVDNEILENTSFDEGE